MKRKIIFIVVGAILFVLITLVAVLLLRPDRSKTFSSVVELPPPDAGFVLTSPNFADDSPIPARFTCDGENVPPTLAWGEPPAGTVSYALVVDDPDAPLGTWTHWIVYNIPSEVRVVDENFRPQMLVNDVQVLFGENSWRRQEYGGPCPPSGTHRYIFQLFALDILLGPQDKATKNELAAQMQNHILGYAELTGTYTK